MSIPGDDPMWLAACVDRAHGMVARDPHIPQHVLFGDAAAESCVEFVAVDPAQHDPLAVDGEDAMLDLDMAESNHRA